MRKSKNWEPGNRKTISVHITMYERLKAYASRNCEMGDTLEDAIRKALDIAEAKQEDER